jgi:hypothetical protein
MTTPNTEDHERAAAGMDYDFPIREKASKLGSTLAEGGPEAFLDEIENLLPETWREHIQTFPLAAVVLGVSVGVWLGMRKGDEIIAAGTSMITAAAVSNINNVMDRAGGEG